MFKSKRVLIKSALAALVFLGGLIGAQAKTPLYPAVIQWQGRVWVTGAQGKRQLLGKKQVLHEKATLETSIEGTVKVQLDENRSILLQEDSELSIPVIGIETGESPVLFLKKGRLRWQQSLGAKAPYNVAIRSDLFEFIVPAGDYVLTMNPIKALAGIQVFEGNFEFSALNGEESARVRSGEQVFFQGVLEEGEIAYDVLLKGKKIPRGRLTPVEPISREVMKKEKVEAQKKAAAVAKKKQMEKIAQERQKQKGVICEHPAAKFNECAWVCLNNPKSEKKVCLVEVGKASCVRRRCNANGVWAEEVVLDAEKDGNKCKVHPVVGACDY